MRRLLDIRCRRSLSDDPGTALKVELGSAQAHLMTSMRLGPAVCGRANPGLFRRDLSGIASLMTSETIRPCLKLSFQFDPRPLQSELSQFTAPDFVPHFNTQYYEGAWSVIPLRSVGGAARQIYPDPTKHDSFADTPHLARCPYVREVLGRFQCAQLAVRFLRLAPGSIIKEHKDFKLGFEDGEVRFHIPVITNPSVEFVLNGSRVIMNEGECWYLDLNLPHRVANRGTTDRIHLVVDCILNDWLRELLLRESAAAGNAHTPY